MVRTKERNGLGLGGNSVCFVQMETSIHKLQTSLKIFPALGWCSEYTAVKDATSSSLTHLL